MEQFLKQKFLSRKFWVMVVSVAYFVTHGMTNEASATIVAWLVAQGLADGNQAQ
jgi:hypothetical protein